MSANGLKGAVNLCVDKLVQEFVENPYSFYTESTMHCYLYELLDRAGMNQRLPTNAGYGMRQLQKEYPPIRPETKGRRGHYDLVVFDPESIGAVDQWNHRHGREPIGPAVAVEMGLNKGLVSNPARVEPNLRASVKELGRLADPNNRVGWGLMLYFYRYVDSEFHLDSLRRILEILEERAVRAARASTRIVAAGCAPDGPDRYKPRKRYEFRTQDGRATRNGTPP